MSEHLFLPLNPLILRSSLLLSELRRDNLRKTKRRFPPQKRSTISSEACLHGFKWKWACPPNYPAVVSHDNYKTQCSPRSPSVALKGSCLDLKWKAAFQVFFYYYKKKKVIYLGTSLRCHIYPSKRQRSRQVTADMSETCTGEGGGVLLFQKQSSSSTRIWTFEGYF